MRYSYNKAERGLTSSVQGITIDWEPMDGSCAWTQLRAQARCHPRWSVQFTPVGLPCDWPRQGIVSAHPSRHALLHYLFHSHMYIHSLGPTYANNAYILTHTHTPLASSSSPSSFIQYIPDTHSHYTSVAIYSYLFVFCISSHLLVLYIVLIRITKKFIIGTSRNGNLVETIIVFEVAEMACAFIRNHKIR